MEGKRGAESAGCFSQCRVNFESQRKIDDAQGENMSFMGGSIKWGGGASYDGAVV